MHKQSRSFFFWAENEWGIFAPWLASEPTAATVGVTKAADSLASFSPRESRKIFDALRVYLGPRDTLTFESPSKSNGRITRASGVWG
jgi:hypothetical protein